MPAAFTSFSFDIDKVLSPISPDSPAGASLRYDAVYDRIRELRREDDATLSQGVWKTDQKTADWPAVESLCLEVLETRSKDLQVAAWLLEAWLHLHGFAGAGEGFAVMRALGESFWDDAHPRIEGGDLEYRLAPVVWINRKLSTGLKLIEITAPEAEGVPACTWADWESACRAGSMPNQTGARGITLARFQQSVMLTPTAHLAAVRADARTMVGNCAALEALLDEKAGKQSPGIPAFRGTGEDIVELIENILRQRRGGEPEPAVPMRAGLEPEPAPDAADGAEYSPATRIRTRAEAYQLLAEAADFLARTEPHSPTPYLVRRAVAWGGMPLEELLPELVRNQSELGEIYRLLNLRSAETPKK